MKTLNKTLINCFFLAIGVGLVGCSKDDDPQDVPQEEGDAVGTVYYENNFDDMTWGGDYIANERGPRPFFKQDPEQDNLRVVDEDREPEDSTPGTDGSMDFFEYMAPSHLVLTGFEGWQGTKVYERPGYIKVGTGSTRDAFVATPALSEITDDQVKLNVSFKVARWETASETVYIEIMGGGTPSVSSVTGTSHDAWVERAFVVNNATPNTRVRFVCDPTMDGRFFLDDIVISKAE